MGLRDPLGPQSVLPRDVPDFVGREVELAALLAAPAHYTAAAVDGMPGVGKTTLAVHAAHLLAPGYPGGQLYLDLHGSADCPPLPPGAALDALLRQAGVTGSLPQDLAERAALWRATAAGRRLLVVLDDAADRTQVGPLLPAVAGCFALVTSRRRLSGLHGARSFTVQVMAEADATTLFARAVGDERAAADPAGAAETVRLCGNLPVAIRIAGARLRHRPTWTVQNLVGRLRDEHRRLAELRAEDRSVSAAFALSYQQLRPQLQRLFRLLGLVPGPVVDTAAATALAGLDPADTGRLLAELLDRHLLVQRVPDRYCFHDLMRQHAREAARRDEPEEDQRAALSRLFDHYLAAAGAAAGVLAPQRQRGTGQPSGLPTGPGPATPAQALDWLEEHRETLVAAVRLGEHAGWPGHAWRIACHLAQLCYVRSHPETWVPTLETGLSAARRCGDTVSEPTVLTCLGVALEHSGDPARAVDCQRRAVVLYQEAGDRAGEATAIKRLGNAHLQLGNVGQALGLYQRALAFFRTLDDPLGVASTLNNIGVTHQAFGRLSEALEHYQGALVIYAEQGTPSDQGLMMTNIGAIQTQLGRYDEALASHQQALDVARRMGDRWREGTALTNIGTVYRHLGRYEEAIDGHRRAMELLRAVAHPGAQSQVANDLAETYRAAARPALAFHHHSQAVALARQAAERRQEARGLDGMAQVCASNGEPEAAAQHWRQALAIYTALNLPEAAAVRARLGTATATRPAVS
jgi:tetratricopeptide (TPR) repeat protein